MFRVFKIHLLLVVAKATDNVYMVFAHIAHMHFTIIWWQYMYEAFIRSSNVRIYEYFARALGTQSLCVYND